MRVRHIRQRNPLHMRTGKDKRLPRLPADARIHRQRYVHIHSIAQRIADHAVRPMHTPAEPHPMRSAEQHIFLGVVEIKARQPRMVFPKRRLGRNLAICLEWSEVLLGPSHQRCMRQLLMTLPRGEQARPSRR